MRKLSKFQDLVKISQTTPASITYDPFLGIASESFNIAFDVIATCARGGSSVALTGKRPGSLAQADEVCR